MGKWRKANGEFLDITVKSGDKTFAPTWDMLREYKAGNMPVEEYKFRYQRLMRDSWHKNKKVWLALANCPEITIACYCKSGEFCHRLCLRDMLEAVCKAQGIEFEYMGEIG